MQFKYDFSTENLGGMRVKKLLVAILCIILIFFVMVFLNAFIAGSIDNLAFPENVIGIIILLLGLLLLLTLLFIHYKDIGIPAFLEDSIFEIYMLALVMIVLSLVLIFKIR